MATTVVCVVLIMIRSCTTHARARAQSVGSSFSSNEESPLLSV